MTVKELLEKDYVVLDGGFGTELQKRGMEAGETSEIMNFKREADVRAVLRSYIEAGSDIISANTFGANRYKLEGSGYTTAQVIEKAMDIAVSAAEGKSTNLEKVQKQFKKDHHLSSFLNLRRRYSKIPMPPLIRI